MGRVFTVLEHPALVVNFPGVSQELLKPTRLVSSLRPGSIQRGKILKFSDVIKITQLVSENSVMLKSISLKKNRLHLLSG